MRKRLEGSSGVAVQPDISESVSTLTATASVDSEVSRVALIPLMKTQSKSIYV